MALEDKALAIIRARPVTYDGLRGELGVAPDLLDDAIANLERARLVRRVRGRFEAPNGANSPAPASSTAVTVADPPPTAQEEVEAAMSKTKTCRVCKADKPLAEMSINAACKDGREKICKKCKLAYQRERKAIVEAEGRARQQVAQAPRAALPPPIAPVAKQSSLAILHIGGGLRVGPLVASSSGLQQMPYYVDLSDAMLDDLTTWWLASKKGAAA